MGLSKLSFAQESLILVGKVQDSLLQPLEFSNIIIYKKDTKDIFTYAITDEKGEFNVEILKDSIYTLKASFIGFENYIESFKITKRDYKVITLRQSDNSLDKVTLVYELPIKTSGDTISYRIDAFTNGKERKLKDVIEKLPGFEIDEEGNVKLQGKKVNKVMVDGKEFFSGDTKLATKNIPANVIEKINVLKNFNDVTPLKGLEYNEDYVIDIKLKEDKKNIVFGSLEGGLGLKKRYNNHANVFYFNPKVNINFIGDINNVGEEAFTFQDYFKFNGGFKNAGKKSSFNLSSDLLGLTGLRDNKAKNSISKLGALNYTFNPNKKLSFSGFLIHSEIDYDILSKTDKTYIRSSSNGTENLSSKINQETTSDLIKLSTKYVPNNKLHLQHDVLLNITGLSEGNSLNSIIDEEFNSIKLLNDNKPISIRQKLDAYYAKSKKSIYSFGVSHQYKNQKKPYNLFYQEKPFVSLIPFEDAQNYNIQQNLNIETNSFNGSFNYYYVINNTNHINFNSGFDYNKQSLNSNITQILNNSEIDFTQNDLLNSFKYRYLDSYIGVNYRTKFSKLTVDTGLVLHVYKTENKQLGEKYTQNKTVLLPNIKLKYTFKKARVLSLNYDINPQFSDVQNLAQGLLIKNYNTLFKGNPNLKNALYHDINLDYYDFNAFNYSNLYAVISFQAKKDDFNNKITYDDINSISTPINTTSTNKVFTSYLSYDRRFRKIKINASVSTSIIQYYNFLEQILIKNQSINQEYRFSLETRIDNFPIIELGLKEKISNYKSVAFSNQSYTTNKPFANIEISFLKNFILTADYEYNLYKSRTANSKSEYDFLNASLFYKKEDSNLEIKLSALNILNTNSIRNDNFSSNFTSTSQYFVQPQYFLINLIYNF